MAAPFKGLTHLRTLSLSRNRIKLVGEHAFDGALNSLEEIDVRENVGLSTVQENAFGNLPKLLVRILHTSPRDVSHALV